MMVKFGDVARYELIQCKLSYIGNNVDSAEL